MRRNIQAPTYGAKRSTGRYVLRMPSRPLACPSLLILALAALPVAGAGQWVEPPGEGWVSLTVYHQDSRDEYDLHGERGPVPGAGHSVATVGFLTVARGLAPGLDAWIQLSFQRLLFENVGGVAESSGVGDARLFVRLNPLIWAGSAFPFAVRLGTKVPVGDFDVGSNLIPLGDGQRDWEVMAEVGRSLYPRPLYVMGWVGYRWREARDGGRLDYGDERFFYAAVGGESGRVGFKLAVEGWYGATPVFNAVRADGAEREMTRIAPSLLLGVGPGQVELGLRRPFGGRNLIAGTDLVVGYFTRFGSG